MKQDTEKMRQRIFSIWSFLIFFLLIAFIVSCTFLVFFHSLHLEPAEVRARAPVTFAWVAALSLFTSLADSIRRRFTVERPTKRILKATQQLASGDFSVRIEPLRSIGAHGHYDEIIENFNKMAQELAGTETLRTDFVANVSHELKTPLAVIQNYAILLEDPTLDAPRRAEYARAISAATQRLSELITNILRLNKLENQQIFPHKEEYELSEQLRECLLGFENIWESKAIEIEADALEEVRIKADPELLKLVWNNLFSNALKFTPPGGRVTVTLHCKDNAAVVQISDTGCGMTPEVGRHIFEKFYQGDRSHATQGNGLGLALVKRVMDIIGGDITVKSTLGEGSTFTVKLRAEDSLTSAALS